MSCFNQLGLIRDQLRGSQSCDEKDSITMMWYYLLLELQKMTHIQLCATTNKPLKLVVIRNPQSGQVESCDLRMILDHITTECFQNQPIVFISIPVLFYYYANSGTHLHHMCSLVIIKHHDTIIINYFNPHGEDTEYGSFECHVSHSLRNMLRARFSHVKAYTYGGDNLQAHDSYGMCIFLNILLTVYYIDFINRNHTIKIFVKNLNINNVVEYFMTDINMHKEYACNVFDKIMPFVITSVRPLALQVTAGGRKSRKNELKGKIHTH
jgi:hypothetical protein